MTRAPSVSRALVAALRAVPLGPEDQAATALAKQYAAQIDDGADLSKLGPPLLAVLAALRMTPAARAAVVKGGAPGGGTDGGPLGQLRALRGTRADRAASMDTSAS